MPDYEHKKIIETITRLDAPPSDAQSFAEWIKANAHLAFLRDNADADEVAVYASGEYTFIHSLIVPNERLSPPDQDDLLSWNCNASRMPNAPTIFVTVSKLGLPSGESAL